MERHYKTYIHDGVNSGENNQTHYTKELIISPNQSLSDSEKTILAHKLTPLTAQGFMRDISTETSYAELFEDVFNHVIPCDRLTIYRNRATTPVAFLASELKSFEGVKVYHLGGIIVDPNLHGLGFSYDILKQDLIETNSKILTFHTQSRLMEKLGNKVAQFDIDLATGVAVLIGTANLVEGPQGPIDSGRYGGKSLYGDIARFDQIAVKRQGFNYLNGDAIVFAGRILP